MTDNSFADNFNASCESVTLDSCIGIQEIETQGTGGNVFLKSESNVQTISTTCSAITIDNSRVLNAVIADGKGAHVTLLNGAFVKTIGVNDDGLVMQKSRAQNIFIHGELNLQNSRIDNMIHHQGAKSFFLSAVTVTVTVITDCPYPILENNTKIRHMVWTPTDVKWADKNTSNTAPKAAKSLPGTSCAIKPTVYQLTVSGTINKLTTDYTGNAELRVVLKDEGKINGTLDPRFTLQRDI